MSKIKKLAILIFLPLALIFPVSAQESTGSAEATVNEITENLRERLQETISGTNDNGDRLQGYVGVVTDVIKNTIVLEDKDGKKNVTVDPDTKITRSPGSAAIKIDNIRIDDYIIAMGKTQDEELVGTKIIVSAESFDPPKKISGIGVADKITKSSLSVTSSSGTTVLLTNSKTIFKASDGLLEYSDIKVGDRVVYAGLDDDGDLTATVIFRAKSAE